MDVTAMMDPDHWTLDEWVAEYSTVRTAARMLDAESQREDDTSGLMPRLISQQVQRNLFRAFGQKGKQFFDIYYQLFTIYKGQPVPPEGLRRPFQAASRFVAQRLVDEETKNLFGDRIATLRRLLQRVEDGKAVTNTWRQLATMYAELMQEVAQDRNVFMKPRAISGPIKWMFFRKMSDREARLQRLKRDDPVLYESIIEARSKLRHLNKEIEKEILSAGMTPSVRSRFGRPIMVGTDPSTGEEYVFDTDGDFLTIPEYDAKVRSQDESRRRLTRTFPRDLESLRTFTDEEIEVYNELLRLSEEEPAATDEEIAKRAEGQVEYVAMTDDKAKASNITRIYPVQEIDGVKVVVGGRFKGIAIDDLVNAAGRMIEGVAYDFDQRNGRPIPIETRGDTNLPNLRVTREPYVTVEQSEDRLLYLRIPNSRDFTAMRGRIFELAKVMPSLNMVKGSRRQGWLFHPKDFAVVREALGGMALSKAAAERLEEHFLDLAQYELATKRENLKHFSLARIGGFKEYDHKGRKLELWNKQREALATLSARGDTGVCALDTGVGKTKVALASIQKMVRDGLADDPETNGRFLFVCPAALKGGLPKSAHRNLVDSDGFLDRVDIMSDRAFAIAHNKDESFAEKYVAIIVDEAHLMVKPSSGRFNPNAQRLMMLDHPRKILMTASPMENDPMQLFVLWAISSNLVAGFEDKKEAMKEFRRQARAFRKRFAEEVGGRVVGINRDPVASRDFRVWVKRNVYFADKRDVEEVALPQLRPETVPLTMDPEVEAAYREATSGVEKVLRAMALKYETRDPTQRDPEWGGLKVTDKRVEAARTKLKALFHRLNELSLMPDLILDEDGQPRFPNAGNPKIEQSVNIIDERISSKRKTLLFTDSPKMATHTARSLSKRFPGLLHAVAQSNVIEVYKNGELAEYVDEKGETKPMRFWPRKYRDSQGVVRKKNEWKAIVLSQKLGGNPRVVTMTLTKSYAVGQNLQMFDTVIHLDRDSWNSEAMKQRTARAWRSGNTENSVDEVTLDVVYDDPRDKLDQTLDEIRKHLQRLESDLFDSVVIDSQSEALGKEWFEMKEVDASFYELNRRMLELTLSPYLARMGEEGE